MSANGHISSFTSAGLSCLRCRSVQCYRPEFLASVAGRLGNGDSQAFHPHVEPLFLAPELRIEATRYTAHLGKRPFADRRVGGSHRTKILPVVWTAAFAPASGG